MPCEGSMLLAAYGAERLSQRGYFGDISEMKLGFIITVVQEFPAFKL